MKICHFGSIDDFNRHKDNLNSCNTMLRTHGDNRRFVAVFENQARSSECTRLFGLIKNSAANINQDHQRGRISLEEKFIRFRTMWIPVTDRYISEWWGLHMVVPLDICRAIADVRSCLVMSTVLWPAILYRDNNVGQDVIILDNVDQFGMVLED